MPDWEEIVGERLGRLRLPEEERREVIAELAAHLEDCYRELCAAGSPDPLHYALAQVSDWRELGRRIRRAKEGPMGFRKRVFIPGMAALTLSGLAMLCIAFMVPRGLGWRVTWLNEYQAAVFYMPWLLALTVVGAMGALLARRAGAGAGGRLLAALFPPLFYLGLFVLLAVVGLIVELIVGRHVPTANWQLWGAYLLSWVAAPAVACALGALPWLFGGGQTAQTPSAGAASA